MAPTFAGEARADSENDQDACPNDVMPVTLPQLLELFAAYFLIDFLEDVGHGCFQSEFSGEIVGESRSASRQTAPVFRPPAISTKIERLMEAHNH